MNNLTSKLFFFLSSKSVYAKYLGFCDEYANFILAHVRILLYTKSCFEKIKKSPAGTSYFNMNFYQITVFFGGNSMDNILKVENLKKTFPNSHFKLNNVSFSIRYGSIVGFIGENGAGKTTAMRTIVGALKKDGGSIKIFGKEINETDAKIKEDIGVVFDQINFSGNLNANELSKVMKNIYKQWNQEKYFEYLKRFSLPTKKKIQGFSRGMSMKLSIAVALSHDPKLLILDEATSGLDPVVRDEILDIFQEFVKDKKHSILLSSHITSDIEKVADSLIFIKNGEIILTVDKSEWLNNYGIFTYDKNEWKGMDHLIVTTYKNKVLVSDINDIPDKFAKEHFSIDDMTLLLLKGEKR